MPRDPVIQGVLGGVLAVIGHEIGIALNWLWRFLDLPRPREKAHLHRFMLAVGAGLILSTVCLWHAADWQNATRRIMGLDPVDTSHPLTIAPVALGVFLALWLLLRWFGVLRRWLTEPLTRLMPPKLSFALGVVVVATLYWMLVNGVLVTKAFEAADASFEAADMLIEPDIPRPEDPQRTGSPASLVRWAEMGRWGRSYVTRGPTSEEIAEFTGPGAMDPIRVYVGRRAADTPRARAEIALAELIRVGGFERKALVVVVPVGTGWMDPGAHDTLDFMLGGDVATIAVQYSYLTSVLSLWAHPEYGIEQARELFDVVYEYWSDLPVETRPELYVHGLSQGAFNSQSSLPLLDLLADPINGALWAGSPFLSPFWTYVRTHREPDSPAWKPRFGNGSLVRVGTQTGGYHQFNAAWGPTRLVFLHYPSDAIVVFSFNSAWQRPDWMRTARAPDVTPEFRWFPVVTMFQLALDMAISLGVPGYGHYYIAPDYIDAWAAVVSPEGWNPARAAELKRIFAARPPAF